MNVEKMKSLWPITSQGQKFPRTDEEKGSIMILWGSVTLARRSYNSPSWGWREVRVIILEGG